MALQRGWGTKKSRPGLNLVYNSSQVSLRRAKRSNLTEAIELLYNLKALFTSANGKLESSGQKLRGIKDFHKDRLVLFGKMHDYRPRLFSVVNLGFGELKHHDIFFSIVTNVHNGSFLLDRWSIAYTERGVKQGYLNGQQRVGQV